MAFAVAIPWHGSGVPDSNDSNWSDRSQVFFRSFESPGFSRQRPFWMRTGSLLSRRNRQGLNSSRATLSNLEKTKDLTNPDAFDRISHKKKMFSKNIQLCKKIISLCIIYNIYNKKRYIYIYRYLIVYIHIYHVSHLTDLWNCPKVERYISSSVISLLRHASADNMFEPQSAKNWKLKNLIWLYCPNDLTISSIYLISKYILWFFLFFL